jgi:hypothetical protein
MGWTIECAVSWPLDGDGDGAVIRFWWWPWKRIIPEVFGPSRPFVERFPSALVFIFVSICLVVFSLVCLRRALVCPRRAPDLLSSGRRFSLVLPSNPVPTHLVGSRYPYQSPPSSRSSALSHPPIPQRIPERKPHRKPHQNPRQKTPLRIPLDRGGGGGGGGEGEEEGGTYGARTRLGGGRV